MTIGDIDNNNDNNNNDDDNNDNKLLKKLENLRVKQIQILKLNLMGGMKNTENIRKLKRIAKEKGKKAIDTAWISKPLHGQYPLRSQKSDVDLHDTHQWLRSAGLKAETERFIIAAQDQSLFTRHFEANILHNGADPRCRLSNTSTETLDHLIAACTILARNEYTNRHHPVVQYIHWKICNHSNIKTPNKWYENKPLPDVDTPKLTIL